MREWNRRLTRTHTKAAVDCEEDRIGSDWIQLTTRFVEIVVEFGRVEGFEVF
jgi:hypothetical protein